MRGLDISIFHKIIILLEHEGECELETLYTLGSKRIVVGSIGRLEALKMIERTQGTDNKLMFRLSSTGDEFLATQLSFLPDDTKKESLWHLCIFHINEKHRSVRYATKAKLQDLGARMLQSGVWVTPLHSVAEQFLDYFQTQHPQINAYVFSGQPSKNFPLTSNKTQLEKKYKSLFNYFKSHYETVKKSSEASFEAKCALFTIAQATRFDHTLVTGTSDKSWIGYQATAWYKKYRKLITN